MCFDCFRPRKPSSEVHKQAPREVVTSSPLLGAQHTAVAVQRDTGDKTQPKRQAKFADLEYVLADKKGMAALREYMTSIKQENMLDFLEDVQDYRAKTDKISRAKFAQRIFDTYVAPLSAREVSLDRPIRDEVGSNLSAASPQLFDAAERAVLEEVRRDVFPKFKNTPLFEKLAGPA